MLKSDYKLISTQLKPIMRKVGTFIKQELGKVSKEQIEQKASNSLVSYVDKSAEEMLVGALSQLIAGAGFITEEETVKQEDSDVLWIIDPLDGTNNFLHGIPHFAVSVGLSIENEIVVGQVLEVNSEELFAASKGNGAYMNDHAIRVSQTKSIAEAIVGTGFPYQFDDIAPLIQSLSHFMKYSRGVRFKGAAALDLAYVACGRYDAYYESGLSPWDVAGGAILIKEAGGAISDLDGGMDYIFGDQLVSSNGHLHNELLQIIQ